MQSLWGKRIQSSSRFLYGQRTAQTLSRENQAVTTEELKEIDKRAARAIKES
jgi:hypothetical protein